jgi:hypothetical protein
MDRQIRGKFGPFVSLPSISETWKAVPSVEMRDERLCTDYWFYGGNRAVNIFSVHRVGNIIDCDVWDENLPSQDT